MTHAKLQPTLEEVLSPRLLTILIPTTLTTSTNTTADGNQAGLPTDAELA